MSIFGHKFFNVCASHEVRHLVLPWLLRSSSFPPTALCPLVNHLRPTTITGSNEVSVPFQLLPLNPVYVRPVNNSYTNVVLFIFLFDSFRNYFFDPNLICRMGRRTFDSFTRCCTSHWSVLQSKFLMFQFRMFFPSQLPYKHTNQNVL